METNESICATNNLCIRTAEQAPPCGSVRAHLPNLPLARQLCTFALDGQIQLENNNTDDWSPARRLTRQGWAHIERGISLPADDPAAEDFLSDAAILTGRAAAIAKREIAETGSQHATDAYVDTRTLDIFLPAFGALYDGEPLGPQELAEQRIALSDLIEEIDESSLPTPVARGLRLKAAAHLLLSRSAAHPITQADIQYYPASAREGRNREPSFTATNHDGYYIMDGTKVPIKARSNAGRRVKYDESILFLPYNDLVTKTHKKIADPPTPPLDSVVDFSVDLLAAEARGEELYPNEIEWLDLTTEAVHRAVVRFCEAQSERFEARDW
ncbi:MAG TPA: hypothetical protein VLE73_05785 [Candidatus Saccharimonadales bacterium]|nr:hypothetical protein [Candidatus Saccharimonadales bacterium]